MKCNICRNKNIKILNYFGEIPRSHDFKKTSIKKKYKFILNECTNCSVIQLKKTGNKNSFIPKFKWITNNEPDEHLNELILYYYHYYLLCCILCSKTFKTMRKNNYRKPATFKWLGICICICVYTIYCP